jgi:arsenate reductase
MPAHAQNGAGTARRAMTRGICDVSILPARRDGAPCGVRHRAASRQRGPDLRREVVRAPRSFKMARGVLVGRRAGPILRAIFFGGASMAVTIHGIRNCDTMKKARAWLEAHGVTHRFHDYKTEGLDRTTLEGWAAMLGWEALLNRAGTTFRKLPESERANLDEAKALGLMLAHPSLVKRPVLEMDGRPSVGFSPAAYARLFGTQP